MRRGAGPEQLMLLAEMDGAVAGAGYADRSMIAGQGSLSPRVLPASRRRDWKRDWLSWPRARSSRS